MQGVTSSASAHYANAWKREQERHGRELLEILAPSFKRRLEDVPVGSSILELGGGGGGLTSLLLEWGYHVITLDHNPALLRMLQESQSSSLEARYHDLKNPLPFKEASFAAVVSADTLSFLADDVLGKLLTEAYRVLKPGGRLLCAERDPTRVVPQKIATDFTQTVPLTLDYELISVRHFMRSDECLGAMIAEAGFQRSEGEPISAVDSSGSEGSTKVEYWILAGQK